MKTSQKGFIAPLLIVIIAVLLAGGGTYLYTQNNQTNPPVTENPVIQTKDFSTVIPQFVSDNLAPDQSIALDEIRGIIASSSVAYDQGYSAVDFAKSLELIAIGKRYVVFHVQSLKAEGGVRILDIFDLQADKVISHIASTPVLQTSKVLIYANIDIKPDPSVSYLCAYKLDTPTCELMPETVIKSNQYEYEEYWSPMGNPIEVIAHTDTSFTITVWSSYGKRGREATYQIP